MILITNQVLLDFFELCEDTQSFHELHIKGKKTPSSSFKMPAANFDVEIDWHSLMKLDDEEELAKNNDENWDELCDSFSDKGDDEEEDLTSLNQQDKDMSASKCVMFASQVTLDGLRVSIQSLVELVDFLLPKYPYVLTEKFSQDVLEV